MSEHIAILPGDGIGPEIADSAKALLDELGDITYEEGLIGGHAMDVHGGDPFPPETKELVTRTDAVLLAAVGGPQWMTTDLRAPRPESSLLQLRQTLDTHANVRPIFAIPSLSHITPLKSDHVEGVDFVVVRELLGGSYYGKRGREGDRAFDTREYSVQQVETIGRTAFEMARDRATGSGKIPRVTNIDKANGLETSRLWRETVTALHEAEYQDVELEHMFVDHAAFQLLKRPKRLDVLLMENEHGDILSDEAALIVGSLGILPSASIDCNGRGIFEPVHGSAPRMAGKGIANPTAMFLSVAMMLDGLGRRKEAEAVRGAVDQTFKQRILTPDLGGIATTREVAEAVIRGTHNYPARQPIR